MKRDIDIALLRAFIAVAETGGMTAASRVLNLTQAAVSQQVKRLEDLFETPLFNREAKRLTLTSAGERLMRHAEDLVALNDDVFSAMRAQEFEADIRLGVPHDIVAQYMPPILRGFHARFPRVRVSMIGSTTPRLLGQLARGEIDMTLTTELEPAKGDNMLIEEALVWVGANGGSAYRRDPLPVTLGDDTCAFRSVTLESLRQINRDWQIMCEVSDTGPMMATLQADLSVAPLLQSSIPPYLEVLPSTARLPKLPAFFVNLHVGVSADRGATAEFAAYVRSEFANRYRRAA